MGRKEWVYVAIVKEQIEQIDEIIKNEEHGYTSRARFVAEAVRNHLKSFK
jgi:metal-responsive CopG/Arc/MetJ family transcriptional regulator